MFEGYSSPHPCQHLVLLFLFKVSAGLHSLLRLQRRIHFSAFWAPQACPHSLAQSPCVLSLKLTPPNWVVLMLPLLCFYCLLFFFLILALLVDVKCWRGTSPVALLFSNLSAEIWSSWLIYFWTKFCHSLGNIWPNGILFRSLSERISIGYFHEAILDKLWWM